MKIKAISNIKIEELTWIAGLLEGEGSFSHSKTKTGLNSPHVSISMTDKDTIENFARLIGGYSVGRTRRKPQSGKKTQWRCAISGKAGVFLAMMVYPWMGQRRRKRISKMYNDYKKLPGKGWMKGLTYEEMGRTSPAPRGEKSGRNKLTKAEVKEIRYRLNLGETHKSIANDFPVARSTITNINCGCIWRED